MTEFEDLILKRLDSFETKLDEVRTKDLPQMKTDVALIIQEGKANSKLHATIGSTIGSVISFVAATYVSIRYGK